MTGHRVVVLGLGNILNTDEGIGVYALWEMEDRHRSTGRYPGIELVDGGTLGMRLLPYVEGATHLLLLDIADVGAEPGTIVELSGDDIPLYVGIKMSMHQVTFQEVLGVALARGHLPPHLHLIGMQPVDLSIGLGPSEAGQRAIPEIIRRAERVLAAWGVWAPPEQAIAPAPDPTRVGPRP
ncbi:MAG: hydrogenase maturation protease [Chloroflexi bacterium]|nr:hydrogenase maturation protease [Chloroflexota bacterium]